MLGRRVRFVRLSQALATLLHQPKAADAVEPNRHAASAVDELSGRHGPATPRRLSCGILILTEQQELLLCHVTGQDHWDLPKGGAHEGESPLQAALRETREETGLELAAEALRELGRLEYRPKKDLHLFATLMPRFDVAQLRCESQFSQYATGSACPRWTATTGCASSAWPSCARPR